ncbi:MAG: penicillin-binding protein 2 [Patescibacteria group bacterium]
MTARLSPQRRLWVLALVTSGLFAVLALRLLDLQVARHSYFEALAGSQRQRSAELIPSRGTIYLTDGRRGDVFPVASNERAYIAYAVPRDITDARGLANELAPALQAFRGRQEARIEEIMSRTGQLRISPTPFQTSRLEATAGPGGTGSGTGPTPTPESLSPEEEVDILREQLYEKFNQHTDPYEPLLKPYEVIDDEFHQFFEDKKFPGIVIAEHERRVYPEGTLAAHALGYVGWSDSGQVGRYGIEEYFDKELAGDLGWLFAERDTAGRFIGVGEASFQPPSDGKEVALTLDRVVQSIIEEELKDGVERYGAERGSILVMNPKTGAVLGMATYPTYDPNFYYAITDANVQANPVVSDIFEPGSIFKPIVMAAAIDQDLVDPDTTMKDTGPVQVAEYKIDTYDGRHWGTQTMTQILEQSNNVGMVWVGQKVGKEKLYDYARRFGVGEQTGIELAGETKSTLPPPSEWNVATVATTSFGQGIAMTPLQELNAINAIANRGLLMQPYIIADRTPTSVHKVVSDTTAEKISSMMVSVIENGVATLAQVPGYYLAGKTGTAQVPDERGKYSPDRKIISFTGFGPASDPQFSILIKLDNPAGLSFASGTTAPMFKHVAEKLLNYYQIPPDYDPKEKQPAYKVVQ